MRNTGGLPAAQLHRRGIGYTIDCPRQGILRDRHYKREDDKTLFSALDELSDVIDGPEWGVEVEWADASKTRVRKVLRSRRRIGAETVRPNTIFDSEAGTVRSWSMTEDYSEGKGANSVWAVSSGQGESRPHSYRHDADALLAAGFPVYSEHYTPSTSIKDVDVLNDHAAERLARMSGGTRTIEFTADAFQTPRLGIDWQIGDDVGYRLVGAGAPDGIEGRARCVGWSLDPQGGTITPVLLQGSD